MRIRITNPLIGVRDCKSRTAREAIYTMLEGEIEEVYDHWNDKEFVAALNKRSEDYHSGKVKAVPWKQKRK